MHAQRTDKATDVHLCGLLCRKQKRRRRVALAAQQARAHHKGHGQRCVQRTGTLLIGSRDLYENTRADIGIDAKNTTFEKRIW